MKNQCSKRSWFTAAVVSLTFGIALLGVLPREANSQEVIKLSYSGYLPETSNNSVVARWWAEELEKRTNGRVKVDRWHYGGSVAGPRESMSYAARGVVDLCMHAPGYSPAQSPLSTMAEMIFTNDVPGADAMAKHELYDTFPALKREFHNSGVELMFYHLVEIGMFGIKKGLPIKSSADLLKLKSHCIGPGCDFMRNVGMTPVALPLTEAYEAMSRGVIQSWFTVFWYHKPGRLYEVTGTMVDPGAGVFTSSFMIMNKKRYDSLPEDVKKVIKDLRNDVVNFELKAHARIDEECHALIKEHAPWMEYVSFSPKARAEWREKGKMDDIIEQYLKEREGAAPEVREFWKQFNALLPKYQPRVKEFYQNPLEFVDTKIID